MSVPTLRWLQIHRYEQFNPVRIEFSEHENLILGVNGAGKTRLLKLLRAILSMDFGELRGQPFDVEFELLTVRSRNAESPVTIRGRVYDEMLVSADGPGDFPGSMPRQGVSLAATLVYESEDTKFTCELKNGEMSVREVNGAFEEVVSYRGEGALLPPFRRSDTSETARKILDMYPICESAFVSEADQEFQVLTRELEYAVFLAATRKDRKISIDPAERLGRLFSHDLFPFIFMVVSVMDRDSISTGLPPFAFVSRSSVQEGALRQAELQDRIWGAIGAQNVQFVPNVVREKDNLIECRGLGLRVRFVDGTEMIDSELTFGQRRFLYAGLMLMAHPSAPFLMDEVDNGLHPRLVETLLNLLAGRQIFLASHNKLVIDYTSFDGPEDVQKKIHVVDRGEDGRQTVRTFDDVTARSVYEKIAVAIQSPSEVLLAEGLW